MNYEEMLNAKEGAVIRRERMPYGVLYKKQIDGKYRFVVELKPALADSIVFSDALAKDCEWSTAHHDGKQVMYVAEGGERNIRSLVLEPGSYVTLAQLLANDPAKVATKGFVEEIISSLIDVTEKLHAEGIYQLCYAPSNILLHKDGSTPMLLLHGSFYTAVSDVESLYGDVKEYMAPEVMNREGGDERSDVYGLGKLIAYLFDQSSLPFEYKSILKKATDADPERRFRNVDAMKTMAKSKRSMRRSLIALGVAVAVALLAVWLYFDLVPQTEYIEFVEPAPKEQVGDPFDDQFDPEMELLIESDTIVLTEEEKKYMEKAEEIYRKRFEKAASDAYSKVYDKEHESLSQKKAVTSTKAFTEELSRQQQALTEETGISPERAEAIANDVLEHISAGKNKEKKEE